MKPPPSSAPRASRHHPDERVVLGEGSEDERDVQRREPFFALRRRQELWYRGPALARRSSRIARQRSPCSRCAAALHSKGRCSLRPPWRRQSARRAPRRTAACACSYRCCSEPHAERVHVRRGRHELGVFHRVRRGDCRRARPRAARSRAHADRALRSRRTVKTRLRAGNCALDVVILVQSPLTALAPRALAAARARTTRRAMLIPRRHCAARGRSSTCWGCRRRPARAGRRTRRTRTTSSAGSCAVKRPPEIVDGDDPELFTFVDKRPASTVHLLVIPRRFIRDASALAPEDLPLVGRMEAKARALVQRTVGADAFDEQELALGFHWPPWYSVPWLHLHAIYPEERDVAAVEVHGGLLLLARPRARDHRSAIICVVAGRGGR